MPINLSKSGKWLPSFISSWWLFIGTYSFLTSANSFSMISSIMLILLIFSINKLTSWLLRMQYSIRSSLSSLTSLLCFLYIFLVIYLNLNLSFSIVINILRVLYNSNSFISPFWSYSHKLINVLILSYILLLFSNSSPNINSL